MSELNGADSEKFAVPAPTVSLVADGLVAVAESAARAAHRLRTCPDEMGATAEAMSRIGEQLTNLTTCATQSAENSDQLHKVVGESMDMAQFLGKNANGGCASCVPVVNAVGRVCDF